MRDADRTLRRCPQGWHVPTSDGAIVTLVAAFVSPRVANSGECRSRRLQSSEDFQYEEAKPDDEHEQPAVADRHHTPHLLSSTLLSALRRVPVREIPRRATVPAARPAAPRPIPAARTHRTERFDHPALRAARSSIEARTPAATRSPPGRDRGRGAACSISARIMGTSVHAIGLDLWASECPTARSTCAGSSTATTTWHAWLNGKRAGRSLHRRLQVGCFPL